MNLIKIIYYIISITSIGLYVMSIQFKDKKNILITQFFASFCYSIVYVIKGAWSGVSIEILEQLKDFTFIKFEKHNKKIPIFILIIFLSLLISVSIIFYNGIPSLIPLFINILLFVSTYRKNPKHMRRVMVISGCLWALYNIYVGAYIIVIGNILEVISATIALIKYQKIDAKLKD